jgi:serine/threonine protein kinase
MMLQGNHYLLVEQLERQQWTSEAYEARWATQDRESGNYVIICETVLPLSRTNMQAFLRRATKALLASSNHPQVIPLQGIFMEHGRGFFVFPQPSGESLQTRIQRMGVLPEEEIITCCLQVAETLEFLSQQNPPVVHGSIRPDHIIKGQSHWLLTNGSIFAAGGATEFITYAESVQRSAYTAPEVAHGIVDTRSDLYSLMIAMYYAITGTIPTEGDIIRQAQMLNPFISKALAAFLARGLHPLAQERYQQPSELFRSLSQRSDYNQRETQHALKKTILREEHAYQKQGIQALSVQHEPHSVTHQQPVSPVSQQPDISKTSFIRPEELPPLPQGNDVFAAICWSVVISFSTLVLLLFAR